jgi:hypothetical protein
MLTSKALSAGMFRRARIEGAESSLDYYLACGLPGKDGYTYDRPFDYFDVQFTAVSSNNVIEGR